MSLDVRSTRSALSAPGSGTRRHRHVDGWLLAAAGMLIFVGLLALYSIDKGGNSRYFSSQAMRILVGFVPALALFLVHPDKLRNRSWMLYALSIAALIAVFAMGNTAKGAQRWIDLGPFEFQPSELSKFCLAITLAAFYANRTDAMSSIWTYLLSLVHVGIPLLLVLMQPHLGGARRLCQQHRHCLGK